MLQHTRSKKTKPVGAKSPTPRTSQRGAPALIQGGTITELSSTSNDEMNSGSPTPTLAGEEVVVHYGASSSTALTVGGTAGGPYGPSGPPPGYSGEPSPPVNYNLLQQNLQQNANINQENILVLNDPSVIAEAQRTISAQQIELENMAAILRDRERALASITEDANQALSATQRDAQTFANQVQQSAQQQVQQQTLAVQQEAQQQIQQQTLAVQKEATLFVEQVTAESNQLALQKEAEAQHYKSQSERTEATTNKAISAAARKYEREILDQRNAFEVRQREKDIENQLLRQQIKELRESRTPDR